MITLKIDIPKEVKKAAESFENFRGRCKTYLAKNGADYDKFTVVSHDSYIGYISEWLIREYVQKEFSTSLKECRTWEEGFDIGRIEKIITEGSSAKNDIDYVKEYFYDEWDLFVSTNKGSFKCDVKTALTKKEPKENWNFLYPVVQAEKEGKDLMILVYYVYTEDDFHDLAKEVLIGAITYELIKNCEIIKKGEVSRFGTTSQTDNYITELARDYRDLGTFF